jgi:hypothetical protein
LPDSKDFSTAPGTHALSLQNARTLKSGRDQEPRASVLEIAKSPKQMFSRDETSDALRVGFVDLNLKSILGIDSVTEDDVKQFPEWLKSLSGTKIRIRGYMYPTYETTGIDEFVLDASARITNFGADPKIYELLFVSLAAGTSTTYVEYSRSVEVVGIFRIDPLIEDGRIINLYSMQDAAIVESKPPN